MSGITYKWVSEQRLLYFTQKLKLHFPTASDFIDDVTASISKAYSSSKVDELLEGLIDDTSTTATDKTWSASKIAQAIADVAGIEFIKPEGGVLPATGQSGAIYLIPNSGTGQNIYDEYIWIKNPTDPSTGTWEKIGTTEIDLSGYVSDEDMVEITTDEIDAIMVTVFGNAGPTVPEGTE